MATQKLHHSLNKYKIPVGLYLIEDNKNKADLLHKFNAAGVATVSIEDLRIILGVPAYSRRLEVALVSMVNGLIAAEYPVILSDNPYIVRDIQSWFVDDIRDIGEVGVW